MESLVWIYFFGLSLEFSLTYFKVCSQPYALCLLVKVSPHLPGACLLGEGAEAGAAGGLVSGNHCTVSRAAEGQGRRGGKTASLITKIP